MVTFPLVFCNLPVDTLNAFEKKIFFFWKECEKKICVALSSCTGYILSGNRVYLTIIRGPS